MPETDAPIVFRLDIEVADVDAAATWYGELLQQTGRKAPGARVYFTCGGVTLQIVNVSDHKEVHPLPKALYFTVRDLDAVFARARALDCLDMDLIHGQAGGEIFVRPWGERSFYLRDPWGNPLCFVQEGTVYPG